VQIELYLYNSKFAYIVFLLYVCFIKVLRFAGTS